MVATSQGTWPALAIAREKDGVADGTRTRDNRNHNPGLYQLSYSHHRWPDAEHARRKRPGPTGSPGLAPAGGLACPTGFEPVTLSLEG